MKPCTFLMLAVESAEQVGKLRKQQGPAKALLEVASLVFVAEWGDRSMLATIALGAAQSPLGVAGGAILAHAAATFVAVLGGAVLSRHISERTVGFLSGILFCLTGAASALGLC
jgi:putative Ca2+/H+ antiporter (TMEM165/GDT1 family)